MGLKSAFKDIFYTLARMFPRDGAVVLVYHSVAINNRAFTVAPEVFDLQMRWLRENNFNTVSLDELARYRAAGKIPKKTVAITIDDGYEDNYTNAFPILKKYNIPATIFITTADMRGAKIDSFPPLPKMNEAQLRELHASGLVSIEPHSDTHPNFPDISESDMEREVRDSKSYIDGLLQKQCKYFAYPKGRNNDAAQQAVARAGIASAYTTEYGRILPPDNSYALKRNGIGAATTFAEFKGIASIGRLAAPTFF